MLVGYGGRSFRDGHKDESQKWSELHNAIREAHMAYKANGDMPDCEALALTMAAIRQEAAS